MVRINPSIHIDCPRCGFPIYVLIEAGPVSVGTKADGTAEASVRIEGIPQPHVCKAFNCENGAGIIPPSTPSDSRDSGREGVG